MVVFYDFEVRLSEEERELKFSGNDGVVYNTVKEFLLQRWKVLKDEFDSYDNSHVMIILRDNATKIKFYYGNVPKELLIKMDSCVSQEDLNYIANTLNNALSDNQPPPIS